MPQGDLTIEQGFNPKGQASLILKNAGLQIVKPKFFKVDEARILQEDTTGLEDKTSWLGTPVFDTFQFLATTYTNLKGESVQIKSPIVLETVLLEVNQPKNIVKTQMAGRNGTVKEFISDGDYEIALTGMIVGKYAHQPLDFSVQQELRSVLSAPVALPIACNFLDLFQVNSVVITDYRIGQMEGIRNAMSVTINCVSDEAFEIQYNEAKKQQLVINSVPSFR